MALTRKRLIQVKKEATYGTDSVPTGTDALLVRNLEITPIEADVVGRDLIRPYIGNSPQLLANTRVSLTFQVELAGSGTAGTAPRFGAILQACGMSETIVATTSVTYAPVSSAFSSATIYFNNDGIRHILTGCRGTYALSAEVGQIPTLDFTMIGVYNAPTDTALPAVTYSAQASPLIFRQGNTSGFQFFSYAGLLQSVSFEIGNENVYRELVGGTKEVLITNRAPSGTVMIEAVSLATKDFFNIAQTETTGNLTFLHGTTAGNRVTFTANQCDITNPTYGDQDGVQMLSVPFVAVPTTAGNDEMALAFT
jgi:hypothetical protein